MERLILEVITSALKSSSEQFDKDSVYFAIIDESDDDSSISSICKVVKEDGRWVEETISGEEPYGFGGKTYQSYLDASDIMTWLHKDYSRGSSTVVRIKNQQQLDSYIEQIENQEKEEEES